LIPDVVAIKLISIFFDLVNAFLVLKILKIRYPDGIQAWMGAALFLALPTVFLNSAYWGQADAIYTCFLLACLLFLLKDQPLPAMVFLGIAFGFKAQAIFLAPFILLLVVKRRIPLLYLGMIPLVYLLLMIPAALTGRPMLDLLTIYLDQAGVYQSLSEHAPNLYLFISNRFYTPVAAIGVGVTALVVVTWVILYARKLKGFTPSILLVCALASAVMMAFFLPKMHDRYFYPAEVLAFLVAFYFPRLWWLALGYQFVSGLVYVVVLRASVVPVEAALAGNLLILAAFVNIALTISVFWVQWRVTNGGKMDALSITGKAGMHASG
jgi:Gpi18-like mannosyltransferase